MSLKARNWGYIGAAIVFLLSGSIGLVAVGLTFAKPYVRIADWEYTMCNTTHQFLYHLDYGILRERIKPFFVPCDPEDDDVDDEVYLTPCTRISVTYEDRNGNRKEATLFRDIESVTNQPNNFKMLRSGDSMYLTFTCSDIHCQDNKFNEAELQEAKFVRTYGYEGHTFECRYNSKDGRQVIVEGVRLVEVIVGITLPCVAFVVGCIFMVIGFVYH